MRLLRLAGPLTTGQLAWAKVFPERSLDLAATGQPIPRVDSKGEYDSPYSSVSRTLTRYVKGGLIEERGRHPKSTDMVFAIPPSKHSAKLRVLDFLADDILGPKQYEMLVGRGASAREIINAISAVRGGTGDEVLARTKAVVELVKLFERNGHE